MCVNDEELTACQDGSEKVALYNENYEQTQVLYANIMSCIETISSGEKGGKAEKDKSGLGMGTIMSLIGVIGIFIAAIIGVIMKVREQNQAKSEAN